MGRFFGNNTNIGADGLGRSRVSVEVDSDDLGLSTFFGFLLGVLLTPWLVASFPGVMFWHWEMKSAYFWTFFFAGVGPTLLLFVWLLPRVSWLPLLAVGAVCTLIIGPREAAAAKLVVHPELTSQGRAETAMLRS